MSLRDTESLMNDISTFLKKYNFFVKAFILWAFISVPWNVTSLMVLKSMKSSNFKLKLNSTQVNYTCYGTIEDSTSWLDDTKGYPLWLGVIIPATIAIVGIIFNIISFIVLRKMEGNEIFKKLLMSLGMKKIVKPKLLLNNMPNRFQHALIAWFFLINFVAMYINYHSAKKKVCGVQS